MKTQGKTGIPDTSTTLLRDVADSQHARWAVFHRRYEPMMLAFMRERFPSLDAEDIVQETFLALAKALPNYTYNPAENGHFHNYLTGILRNKALKALVVRNRDALLKSRASASPLADAKAGQEDNELKAWRNSVYEIALQQFLADESVREQTKQVFLRLAVNGERPESVAETFGMSRSAVDMVKSRGIERLKKYIKALKGI